MGEGKKEAVEAPGSRLVVLKHRNRISQLRDLGHAVGQPL